MILTETDLDAITEVVEAVRYSITSSGVVELRSVLLNRLSGGTILIRFDTKRDYYTVEVAGIS